MAKITRVLQKIFGLGGSSNVIKFGSDVSTPIVYTKDVSLIQSLSAWTNGWASALVSSVAALENQNAVNYVTTSQIAYLMQEGIAEYNAETTYYQNSIVKKTGTVQLYKSKTNDNVGNALTNLAYWSLLGDLSNMSGISGSLLSQNGYIIYSNGLIEQWGTLGPVALFQEDHIITLPISYPTANLNTVLTVGSQVYLSGALSVYIKTETLSNITIVADASSAMYTNSYIKFRSLGY
jgi:hypothetical protein